METPKYNLIEATQDEQNEFLKRFDDLCTELSIYFEPVPQFARKDLTSPWEVTCQIFLRKKVPNETPIPSPFPTDDSSEKTA